MTSGDVVQALSPTVYIRPPPSHPTTFFSLTRSRQHVGPGQGKHPTWLQHQDMLLTSTSTGDSTYSSDRVGVFGPPKSACCTLLWACGWRRYTGAELGHCRAGRCGTSFSPSVQRSFKRGWSGDSICNVGSNSTAAPHLKARGSAPLETAPSG